MGLSVSYTLSAQNTLSHHDVRKLVQRAARYARRIGCARVGKVLYATESDPQAPEFYETSPKNQRRLTGGRGTHGWLVEVWPGQGCETAVFGLLRDWRRKPGGWGSLPPDARLRWKLYNDCKTCYAVEHGTEHFVQCHLRVIKMLDFWRKMGVRVEVNDDGGYWQNRSAAALAPQAAGLRPCVLC